MLPGQPPKLGYVVRLLPVIPIDTTYMGVFIVKTTAGKIYKLEGGGGGTSSLSFAAATF